MPKTVLLVRALPMSSPLVDPSTSTRGDAAASVGGRPAAQPVTAANGERVAREGVTVTSLIAQKARCRDCHTPAEVQVDYLQAGRIKTAPCCLLHGKELVDRLYARPIIQLYPLARAKRAAALGLPPRETNFTDGCASPTRNPLAAYLGRLAPQSRRTMRGALDIVARYVLGPAADAQTLRWDRLRHEHTALVRARLVDEYAPATTSKVLAALRQVLREAWNLGLLDADTYYQAASVKEVPVDQAPGGFALTRKHQVALFAVCGHDPTPWGRRDAALLTLLFGAGLRRAEIGALVLADYCPDTGEIVVRSGKQRTVSLPPSGRTAISHWLAVRGPAPGPLLCPVRGGRLRPGRGMCAETIYCRLKVLARRAGVPTFTPQDARRTYIASAIEDGEDLLSVMRLAGHAKIETTARYAPRGDHSLRNVGVKRFLPYHPPPVPPSSPAAPCSLGAAAAPSPAKAATRPAPRRGRQRRTARRKS